MTAADWFTRGDGTFLFARWGRPIVPVIFGLDDAQLPVFKGAIEAMVALAGHRMAEVDVELGANLMLFFVREWDEVAQVPHLDRLIPGLPSLLARLEAAGANQYRIFRFDAMGAIRACFAFVRVDADLAPVPVATLALNQAVQVIVLWSDVAFAGTSALAVGAEGVALLRPEVAALVRAAYDPVLPQMSHDAAFALRLDARIAAAGSTARAGGQ